MAETLKQTVLSALDREALKSLISAFEIAGVDQRSYDSMRSAIDATVDTSELLEQLYKPELQTACEYLKLSNAGNKAALIERLLAAPAIIENAPSTNGEERMSNDDAEAPHEKKTGTKRAKSAAKSKSNGNGANLGFEAKLWLAADKLRNNMDAAEYKHVVLGLIFLKYISDAFAELYDLLAAGQGDYEDADPEDQDEYKAENVFWVPPEARWQHLQDNAKQPTIGKLIDDAMAAIERDNPRLKGVLPQQYARRRSTSSDSAS
ncbi:MAG: type I restriction-modification system subunit M N-terminal domain-containing protein [Pirellulales bacterium]